MEYMLDVKDRFGDDVVVRKVVSCFFGESSLENLCSSVNNSAEWNAQFAEVFLYERSAQKFPCQNKSSF